MNKTSLVIASLAVILSSSSIAYAHPNGETGVSVSGCGGRCHGPMSASTSVRITGPSSVVVGSMNTFELIITNTTSGLRSAGLNIAATTGTLGTSAMAPLTQIVAREITHSSPIAANAVGMWTIPFNWTAPATPGGARLTAAGNAVNGDRASSGDQWNTTMLAITVTDRAMADSGVRDSGIAPADSGVPPMDSGVAPQDSGVEVDTGVPADDASASADTGAPRPDASSSSDAGTPADGGMGMMMRGCGCTTAPTAVDPRGAMLALAAIAAALTGRRKRAHTIK